MKAPIWSLFFLNSCFCFIFFLIYILMMTFHIFFLLFVKKCPGGECISVSDFFPLVFSSIGFPIEKNPRNFGVRKKLLLFFYYYLGQWNSFFFVTVFIWAVFFSLGFLFFSLEQSLNADRGNSSNGEIFYVSLPLRRQLEELYSHPLYAIDMNWKN